MSDIILRLTKLEAEVILAHIRYMPLYKLEGGGTLPDDFKLANNNLLRKVQFAIMSRDHELGRPIEANS